MNQVDAGGKVIFTKHISKSTYNDAKSQGEDMSESIGVSASASYMGASVTVGVSAATIDPVGKLHPYR